MARRGENIYKRKDGRWEGRYKKGRKSNGCLKYGYIYGNTYKEVKESLYVYKLKYKELIQFQGESTSTYEEWIFNWLNSHKEQIKTSTYGTYLYKFKKYILPFLGTIPLNEITREDIQSLIFCWQKKLLQPTTIQVLYQIVKKSFKEAFEQKLIPISPCQRILLPKKKSKKIKALSSKEQKLLEVHAKTFPLYKGLPVLLALDAGLRIGEISALRWEDIDLENYLIYVKETVQRIPLQFDQAKTQVIVDDSKTNYSIRTIPMTQTLHKYLKEWNKESTSKYVCSNKSTPSEPRLLTRYFHAIRKQSGIPSVHFHHLRHTFATRCIESNGDIASISKLLGHKSTRTTLDVYTDSMLQSRKYVIERMEQKKTV